MRKTHQQAGQASVKTEDRKFPSKFISIGTICILFLALAFVAVFFFNVSLGTLLFAAMALACPLLHVWMMKNGQHKH